MISFFRGLFQKIRHVYMIVQAGLKAAVLTEENYHFLFCWDSEVALYLLNHDMVDLTRRIYRSTCARFPYAELELKVYHDPEIADEHLSLYVRLDIYPDNMMDIIEDISTEYEEEHAEARGWLLVTTDFN